MTPAALAWKQIAWNGISISIPQSWEVEKIGNHYLALEENTRPVMELKWHRVKGNFSHRKHLRRLAGLYNKNLTQKINASPLPSEWEQALDRFDAKGFSWRDDNVQGIGAIIYCPICQTATLIQFYRHKQAQTAKVSQHILTSFRDHRKDQMIIWAVFDIRAAIPAEYTLEAYRLEAGRFSLAFTAKHQKLKLYRWGPAAVLLSEKDLLHFLRDQRLIPEAARLINDGKNQIEGIVSSSSGRWPAVINLLKPRPSFQAFRFWHLEDKNRILGVYTAGKKAISNEGFNALCSGYESL
ncbi:hypothetical protein ACFLZL_05345 [Thermodesulfobacteriota bacterium]